MDCRTNVIHALFILQRKGNLITAFTVMLCEPAGLGPAMARGVIVRFLIVQYSFRRCKEAKCRAAWY